MPLHVWSVSLRLQVVSLSRVGSPKPHVATDSSVTSQSGLHQQESCFLISGFLVSDRLLMQEGEKVSLCMVMMASRRNWSSTELPGTVRPGGWSALTWSARCCSVVRGHRSAGHAT